MTQEPDKGGEFMQIKSFLGGAHIPHFKEYTDKKAIELMNVPDYVVIPLLQHWGETNVPIVRVGDHVKAGQKIGESSEFFSAPVHSSVNGIVEAIDNFPHFEGGERLSVKIRTEGTDHTFKPVVHRDPETMTTEELRSTIRETGLVGMGGAAFPTHANISPKSPVDTLLINGAECEPFLTCDHRMMVERTDELLAGARIMMRCIGATRCFIGIEVNKPDAIEAVNSKIVEGEGIEVVPLEVKYPQGYKSYLIKAITGRNVPRGARSAELGCVVRNVGTTIAGYEAVVYGKPLIERVVTVSGPQVAHPGNYVIKIGTEIGFVLEQCGVTELKDHKVILGGPMTGIAQKTLDAFVVKSTTGVLVLPPEMAAEAPAYTDCVRCGKCVEHCPMLLYPNQLSIYAEAGMIDELLDWNAMDCMDCGICAFICPGHRPVAQMIRESKPDMKKRMRSRKTG
jgi:Na+-translocating ferredoxin:NAD+ oxidoreductase subunit C